MKIADDNQTNVCVPLSPVHLLFYFNGNELIKQNSRTHLHFIGGELALFIHFGAQNETLLWTAAVVWAEQLRSAD